MFLYLMTTIRRIVQVVRRVNVPITTCARIQEQQWTYFGSRHSFNFRNVITNIYIEMPQTKKAVLRGRV